METGATLIAAERKRQIEIEGWTRAHDEKHTDKSIAYAALTYLYAYISENVVEAFMFWKWDIKWLKIKNIKRKQNKLRCLVKAGALIAAEIDRIR